MINWIVRFKNKSFWIAIVPAIILLIQAIGNVFGYTLDFSELTTNLLNVVECAFVVLTILGIVVDPTTKGIGDSERALNYTEPN